ncbi:hypothetical protein Tco_0573103 [Tanacetum coccineum]
MLLATKDEAGIHLDEEENDFMHMRATGDDQLEELKRVGRYTVFQTQGVGLGNWQERPSMSVQTIHMLGNTPNSFYDPNFKTSLGYQNPERLRKANKGQPKFYSAELLSDEIVQFNLYDTEETLAEAEKSRLKMKDKMIRINYAKLNSLYETFVPQSELFVKQRYFLKPVLLIEVDKVKKTKKNVILQNEIDRLLEASLTVEIRNCVLYSVEQVKNQKKSKVEKLDDENVSLGFQVESLIKECENVKLEYQKIFNSIKTTQAQHQKEVNELVENVNQKTYAYADVRSQNQDLLMTISELKTKLKYAEKGKNVNTKFDKSSVLGKLVPYVRRMIVNRARPVAESTHEQTDDEPTDKEAKQMEADDQAIQIILMGFLEDIYAAEKKAKLFNEQERFNSTEGESVESYYHRFAKLMNDFAKNKHYPEQIANNLKFLNNLQPEWKRHVTIVHQTKDLYKVDYNQLYDFLKMNQEEVNEIQAE